MKIISLTDGRFFLISSSFFSSYTTRFPVITNRWVLIPYGVHVTSETRSSPGLISRLSTSSGKITFISSTLYASFSPSTSRKNSSPSFNSSRRVKSLALARPRCPVITQCVFSPPYRKTTVHQMPYTFLKYCLAGSMINRKPEIY